MLFRSCLSRTAALAVASLAACFANAAEPLTLAQAQAIAVARSQQVAASEAAATAARRMAQAAGQLPDPVLRLGIDNLPVTGADRFSLGRDFMTMRRVGIAQELPASDKRRLRAQRAAQDAIRLQAERELLAANARRDTALAWLDRYYALQQRELLLQQADEARLQVEAAEAGYRSGRGSQSDAFAARAAASMLEDKLIQADTQARNAGLLLARWVGSSEAERLPAGAPPWQATELDEGLSIEHLERHPGVAIAAAVVDAAQLDVFLAQTARRPDWTVEASYSQRGSGHSDMVSIGVSVPLQLDRANKQDQELAARLAQVDEALARYEETLRSEETEIGVMLNDWRAGKQRVARYAGSLLPLARQRTSAALAAYRGGRGDLASVLSARREQLELQLQAVTAELETARAWARLNFLSADHDMPAVEGSKP